MDDVAKDLLKSDFEGAYSKHTQMWNIFHNTIKIYGIVASIPILLTGAIDHKFKLNAIFSLNNLPEIYGYILFACGILAFTTTHILIRYRLDIIMYARAINSIRAIYVKTLENNIDNFEWPKTMPTKSNIPPKFEPLRPMGYLVMILGAINAIYFTVGLSIILDLYNLWGATSVVITLCLVQFMLYAIECERKILPGSKL